MTPYANQLMHVGQLQSFVRTGTDDHGQPVGAWETVSTVRTRIDPISARTSEYAHQLYDLATHILWMRYRVGVTSAMRLIVGDRVFHFGHVESVSERGRWMRIVASEVPA